MSDKLVRAQVEVKTPLGSFLGDPEKLNNEELEALKYVLTNISELETSLTLYIDNKERYFGKSLLANSVCSIIYLENGDFK